MTGEPGATRTVAVVGVGASGTLVALHLLRAARTGSAALRLILIDGSGRFGPGIAYATSDPHHLLNTPAGRLSAYADDPAHFTRWAGAHGHGDDPAAFLPRRVYGRYLSETLRAAARGADVEWLADDAVELGPGPRGGRIGLRSGGHRDADAVVLTVGAGSGDAAATALPVGDPRYVGAPWQAGELDRISDDAPVLVVGTGLTMVDVTLTLGRERPGAVVHAISRHGLTPRPHRPGGPSVDPAPPPTAATLAQLVRQVRVRIDADPARWREVIDGIRPHVPELWRRLDVEDRHRFHARLLRFWDVHRHRVAPVVDARLTDLHRCGRVHVHAGRVRHVRTVAGGFDVTLALRSGSRRLRVGWIVNATGFAAALGSRPDPLIARMLDDDLVAPDALGLGIDTTADGRVVGRTAGAPHQWMFAVGALRRGTLFESTAVPEIRAQAAAVAALAIGDSTATTPAHVGAR